MNLKTLFRPRARFGISAALWLGFVWLAVFHQAVFYQSNAQDCDGFCADSQSFLTTADVTQIISQAVQEAQALNVEATIAVADRVGNILAVYRMGQRLGHEVHIVTKLGSDDNSEISGGLEGVRLPLPAAGLEFTIDDQAAISKAITGAYLSSEGNAFTTRTASQIIQQNFNPGEKNQPSGPLFGVQFSQLSCSDFTTSYSEISSVANNGSTSASTVGPHRSPLGLSADPGGFPLYKAGVLVGGVGVLADGVYSIDENIADTDYSIDELIAVAASWGFSAPEDRRANRITVEGKTLRFSDVDNVDLNSIPQMATEFTLLGSSVGALVHVPGYNHGVIRAGTAFGQADSGIRADSRNDFSGLDAFVFVDENNIERYPPVAGMDEDILGDLILGEHEVRTILQEALKIANRARGQIRRPLGSQARVTITVVDSKGNILGMVRGRDAPIFGSDVSVQKARTTTFFSSARAANTLDSYPPVNYLRLNNQGVSIGSPQRLFDYVTALRVFVGDPNALANGQFAFSDRAGGNLSRPFYPDGLSSGPHGPLSKGAGFFSVFSPGLQLDLVYHGILQHILAVSSAGVVADVSTGCAGIGFSFQPPFFIAGPADSPVRSGIQIFPGSVPIYRGEVLVGGIGVSGDGVDQDDMISFLGLHNAGERLNGAINNAPINRRADNLSPQGVRLRFIQCPFSPFLDGNEQNVCENK